MARLTDFHRQQYYCHYHIYMYLCTVINLISYMIYYYCKGEV
jgi:hypothetical protein